MVAKEKTKVVSVRVNVSDEHILRNMAKFKGVTFTELMRTMIEKQIEEEIDKALYSKAVMIHEDKSDEVVSWDIALQQLGIKNEI